MPAGEVLRSMQPRLSLSRRVPVGVVGVIAPFNSPILLALRAIAPALAVGNAVVLKPDPRTAVVGGVLLARVFEEAGLPAGLLHVLPGGADVGEAIVADPDVPVIAFTGSTGAGKAIAAAAAKHLKRTHLELGGNSADDRPRRRRRRARRRGRCLGQLPPRRPDLHGHRPAPGPRGGRRASTSRGSPRPRPRCAWATRRAPTPTSAR